MPFTALRAVLASILGFVLLALAPVAEASAMREGFEFPADGEIKIVVFRPDVSVGTLRVGGLDEPNADWTAAARANIQTAMEAAAEAKTSQMRFLGEYEGVEADLVNQHRGTFEAVAGEVFLHHMFGDRLPTKTKLDAKGKKQYLFDWTLGPDAEKLRAVTGGDYALFFFMKDSYGDAGRKVAQLLMAGLFGTYIQPGVHIGYAGLVDLKTGNLAWFNADIAMGGDPRDADGAIKRVSKLLAGFPKRGTSISETGKP